MARASQLLMMAVFLSSVALTSCAKHCGTTLPDGQSCKVLDLGTVVCEANPSGHPLPPAPYFGAVSTVLNPEGENRYISLAECFAFSLENGRSGDTSVRVLSYDPAIAYTAVEESLSRFDATWRASMAWNRIDERAGNALQSVLDQVLQGNDTINQHTAQFGTSLAKPLPTGGVAGITFRTDYEFDKTLQPNVNPSYRPRLVFGFEQPLLQGAGVTINQIRGGHPGSLLFQTNGAGGLGILVARLAFDQARDQFSASAQNLLFAVEEAYWNLYASYWDLHSTEVALRQAYSDWELAQRLFEKNQITIQDLAAIEQQYQTFRLQRLEALGGGGRSVLGAERALRQVIGLPPEDGTRLIPVDTPTAAAYRPDWLSAVNEALAFRPELLQSRRQIKSLELAIVEAKDENLPDLRLFGTYDINGLGNRLDGPDPQTNAFRSLASNHFNNWTVGVQMEVPIGFRQARARLRREELRLGREQATLRDQESQAVFALQASYRRLHETAERIRIQTAIRKAATTQYQARQEEFRRGVTTVPFLVEARRLWFEAQRLEHQNIFDYNIALADFERQKGTNLSFNNVTIAEGPLPSCVEARASENIRKRQQALILCKRSAPASCEQGSDVRLAPPTGWASSDLGSCDGPPHIPQVLEAEPLPPETLKNVTPPAPATERIPTPKKVEEALPPKK